MSSLINFLHPKLKPAVESDTVCEDGYEISNLIADDADQLSRGFLAFCVTKPPAEIVFEFPKAIEVKVIKLWNTIHSMRSTGFEVHGKYEGIWERVAYVRDLGKGIDSVTFCYQSDYSSRSNAGLSNADQQSTEKAFFFKTAHKILANTRSIKITIRATHKCPPLLRQVQIWGLPARSLEKVDKELIKTIWNEITNPLGLPTHERERQLGQRSPLRTAPELQESSKLQIPEEFLDSITWELMTFPTVLPSGKVVDQSTIDKHSEVEAKWGRLPSDPFTGLEFTPHRKAILNLALKSRIEKFLMDNSEHFKSVPRCLGSSRQLRRSRNRHASQFASLCQGHSSSLVTHGTYSSITPSAMRRTSGTIRKVSYTVTSTATATDTMGPQPSKRFRYCGDADYISGTYPHQHTLHGHHHHHRARLESKPSTITAPRTEISTTLTSSSSVGTARSPMVDGAIQQALSRMTRYTIPAETTTSPMCINCKCEEFSYEIQTCKHLVCRECLVKLTQDRMCSCKTSFCNADVERYHRL